MANEKYDRVDNMVTNIVEKCHISHSRKILTINKV